MGRIKSALGNFKDRSLQLKMVALCLNLLNIVFWRAPERGVSGFIGPSQECLFAHTVPAYMVLLACLVLVHALGAKCGIWFHRVFELSGSALFGTCSVIVVFNCSQNNFGIFPLLSGIGSGLISIILFIDVLLNEGIFRQETAS